MKKLFYFSVRFFLFCFFKLFFFFKVHGRENIPKEGGCIIAANHQSFLDPPVIGAASPRICGYMAKKELFEGRIFGKIIEWLYAFPVEREIADFGAIRIALNKLKQGEMLAIFPEGHRSVSGEVGPAQPGVGLLAVKSGVPVVPMLIAGTEKAMPADSNKLFFFNPIRVYFGKPLIFSHLTKNKVERETYQAVSEQIVREIKNIKKNL